MAFGLKAFRIEVPLGKIADVVLDLLPSRIEVEVGSRPLRQEEARNRS